MLLQWKGWRQTLIEIGSRENALSPDDSREDFALQRSRKMGWDLKSNVGPRKGFFKMGGVILLVG